MLPVNKFPMIFEAAAGEAEQETNCTRLALNLVANFTLVIEIRKLLSFKHQNGKFSILLK